MGQLSPMDPLNGTNGCIVSPMAMRSVITGTNGCVPLVPMAIAIGDHWIHFNGSNETTRW